MSGVSLKGKSVNIDLEEGLIRRLRKQELVNRHGKKLLRKNRSPVKRMEREDNSPQYPMLIDFTWLEEKHQRDIVDANRLVCEDLVKLFQTDYFQLIWGNHTLPEYVSFGGSLIVDTSPPIFSLKEMMDSLSEEL